MTRGNQKLYGPPPGEQSRVIGAVRAAQEKHGAAEWPELVRLQAHKATLEDLEHLAIWGEMAGLDWAELFPEWSAKRKGGPIPPRKWTIPEASMGPTAPQRTRKQLRAEAKRRAREVLPQLKSTIREAKAQKKTRGRACRSEAKRAAAALKMRARKARTALAARVRKLQDRLKQSAQVCKSASKSESLTALEKSLQALEAERTAIADLKRQASMMRSESHRKGGQRAAELRQEADEEVANELPNDPAWRKLWKVMAPKIRATSHASRAEKFLEYVHDHPHALDEQRAKLEHEYERDAERLFAELAEAQQDPRTCPRSHMATVEECEKLLGNVPF